MGKPRYNLAGVRDYTGVSLEDIIPDIAWLHGQAVELIPRLQGFEEEVKKNRDNLVDPDDIVDLITYHISLFKDYAKDLKRLMKELPRGVEDRHIRIVESIKMSASQHERGMILDFKKDFLTRVLRDEKQRPLLDKIYASIRQYFVDVLASCSFINQLATFVGTKSGQVSAATPVESLAIPEGTSWSDIHILFIGDYEIYVKVGKQPMGVLTYARCGMADLKTNKPNMQWKLLKLFADYAGDLPMKARTKDGTRISGFQKQVSLLRSRLSRLFGLSNSPIADYEKKTKSFRSIFQIGIGEPSELGVKLTDIKSILKEGHESAWDQQIAPLKNVID